MVETRIKPHLQQQAEQASRDRQQRAFRRNQVFGLLLVAAQNDRLCLDDRRAHSGQLS